MTSIVAVQFEISAIDEVRKCFHLVSSLVAKFEPTDVLWQLDYLMARERYSIPIEEEDKWRCYKDRMHGNFATFKGRSECRYRMGSFEVVGECFHLVHALLKCLGADDLLKKLEIIARELQDYQTAMHGKGKFTNGKGEFKNGKRSSGTGEHCKGHKFGMHGKGTFKGGKDGKAMCKVGKFKDGNDMRPGTYSEEEQQPLLISFFEPPATTPPWGKDQGKQQKGQQMATRIGLDGFDSEAAGEPLTINLVELESMGMGRRRLRHELRHRIANQCSIT